tara:strand:- start:796 stop:1434 length:639 start_codon:yes stop_codon:yes gene_type:complete
MKIHHRYRNLIDSSFSDKIEMKKWDFYDEDDKDCTIYTHKENDKKKMAIKKVVGLFANEIAYTFWNIDENVKLEWDQSVQSMKVLEILSPNCAIIHLKMKRIWPAKSRDCVICSELLQVGEYEWIVNNISVKHPLANIESDYTRMECNINMIVKENLINPNKERTRDNIISTISFKADVDLGNWMTNVIVSKMGHKTWITALDDLCNSIKKK